MRKCLIGVWFFFACCCVFKLQASLSLPDQNQTLTSTSLERPDLIGLQDEDAPQDIEEIDDDGLGRIIETSHQNELLAGTKNLSAAGNKKTESYPERKFFSDRSTNEVNKHGNHEAFMSATDHQLDSNHLTLCSSSPDGKAGRTWGQWWESCPPLGEKIAIFLVGAAFTFAWGSMLFEILL